MTPAVAWGQRGEILGAACLDRKPWKNSAPDAPNNPATGKRLRTGGMEVRLSGDFLIGALRKVLEAFIRWPKAPSGAAR